MHRILAIDDDTGITTLLRRGLTYEGFAVDTASTGEDGLRMLRERHVDLVILDVMMPGMDGISVLSRVRAADPDLPVLMLTARDAPDDQVRGFDAGADDYVTKPFSFDVLVARVRALLRRRQADRPDVLRFEDVEMRVQEHAVRRGAREIVLTAQEFRVLQVFMENPGRVLSKPVLLDRAWGIEYVGDANVVEVYVKQLRQKLEQDGGPRLIHTIRGVGYVLRGA